MIHFRSFDIIKILKISLPISITLSEKKKIPIIQQREERDGEQKEKERQRKRIKVPSFIRNAVLRRTESESQRPFSPGQLVRRSCDIAWNSKAVDRMVGERRRGRGAHSLGGFGVARLESRSAVPRWFIRVGQDQQPGELFSRCVSYLFIGGSESRATILARARRENWGGTLSTLPPPPSSFPLGVLTGKRRGERKSERRGRKWRRRLDGAEAGRRRCASMPSYRPPLLPPLPLPLGRQCVFVMSSSSVV